MSTALPARTGGGGGSGRPPLPAVPRHALALAGVVVLGSFMTVLDMTIVNVALGHLSRSFDAPLSVVQWTVTGYSLALATVIPVTAWAVGRYGAKRVFLTAVALFTLGSGLTGLAWNVGSLIAFRVVQGLGGGMIVPVAMTVVLRAAPPERKGTMMGILGIPVLVGPMAGPVLGGVLTDALSWRWIFFVNVPVGALALLLGARVMRGDGERTGRPLDLAGLLTLPPGLALLLYGLTLGGERGGFGTPGAVVPVVAGAVLVAAFAVRALRTAHPLLDLRLLRRASVGRAVATMVPFSAAYFGSMILVPLYWQQERGLSATQAGLLMVPQFLCSGTVMQISSRISDRVAPRAIVVPGVLVAVTGFLAFAVQAGSDVPHWRLVASLAVMGTGVGMTNMPVMASATRGLADTEVAAGSTALNIVSQVAASVGTALTASLLTATDGFRTTLLCGAGLMALALPMAVRLPKHRP
ncbi:DHA2 family efflux MFS transporter permease subunit [Streptomyces sp. M2CJ-2]|uniref:DHA2 family efflux MFS transporter permease subunit n=1 Tax=Streptomyces sp. M2CJ-2 TaxID=2803948 RepID=UPI0019262EB9|nr:DHA2 family efflux MFS transporter permease subunit [Streptomyces sp. M2CJ-2]MBL3667786.1 DHA2 family efflux MFS transporter permease subunit [Streptomyces sp. M2CJ-2]